jgi:glycosyltransferase involved in cell wall biosynthesis
MACGLPTIASKHGGNLEFMNDDNSTLVTVGEEEAVGYNSLEPTVTPWMTHRPPVVKYIRQAMRLVYEGSVEVRERALKGRRVAKDFPWGKAAKKIIDIVEGIQR